MKLILNIAETINDFLPFFFHISLKATSKEATLALRHIETIANKARE